MKRCTRRPCSHLSGTAFESWVALSRPSVSFRQADRLCGGAAVLQICSHSGTVVQRRVGLQGRRGIAQSATGNHTPAAGQATRTGMPQDGRGLQHAPHACRRQTSLYAVAHLLRDTVYKHRDSQQITHGIQAPHTAGKRDRCTTHVKVKAQPHESPCACAFGTPAAVLQH